MDRPRVAGAGRGAIVPELGLDHLTSWRIEATEIGNYRGVLAALLRVGAYCRRAALNGSSLGQESYLKVGEGKPRERTQRREERRHVVEDLIADA